MFWKGFPAFWDPWSPLFNRFLSTWDFSRQRIMGGAFPYQVFGQDRTESLHILSGSLPSEPLMKPINGKWALGIWVYSLDRFRTIFVGRNTEFSCLCVFSLYLFLFTHPQHGEDSERGQPQNNSHTRALTTCNFGVDFAWTEEIKFLLFIHWNLCILWRS